MFTYQQSNGKLYRDGLYYGIGWAGQGYGKNNSAAQNIPNIGPLPQGRYKIGPAYHHPHLGPVVMALVPDEHNQMFNRAFFRIHGAASDNPATPQSEYELSSHGCIIMPRPVREKIAASGDQDLEVIA